MRIPSEFSVGGIYLDPLLVAAVLGVGAAALTAMVLNRLRLSRFIWLPQLAFLALAVLWTVAIGTWVVPT
ncbi:MAG: DUF1656 domain-containing protein [Geminicoccaceae bacterium]